MNKSLKSRIIEVTLPEETIQLMDTLGKGSSVRNALIQEAVEFYLPYKQRENLRQSIQEGAIQRAKSDLALAIEWSGLEESW